MPNITQSKFNLKAIRLEPPHVKYKSSYLEAMAELQTDAEKSSWIYLGESASQDTPARDFEAYVQTLRSTEARPLPGFVKNTCYWAIYGDEMIGRIALRHELNEFLKNIGGHIGYIVRPSFRDKGVATEMLRQLLETDRAKSIGRLLVTCDENNTASERTILKNGGVFESFIENGDKPRKKRFWIDLPLSLSVCQIAEQFASLMDQNKYDEAGQFMHPDCRYLYQGNVIEGRENILQTYETNYSVALQELDEIRFLSETVPDNGNLKFRLKYLDRVRKGSSWFEHRCEQTIRFSDNKIIEIEHFNLPGEAEKLREWRMSVGIIRA